MANQEIYEALKKEYDAIGDEIRKLHQQQNQIQKEMSKACPHPPEALIKVDNEGPFGLDEWDEEEEKYKCTQCFRYFTK